MTTAVDVMSLDHDAIGNMTEDELSALIAANGEGDTASNEPPAIAPEQAAAPDKATEATEATLDKADGVLARDGKNIIPFEVLDATRRNLSNAEAKAQAAEARIAELNAELAQKAGIELDDAGLLSEEDLALLAEEMPEVGKTIAALQTQNKQQAERLAALEVASQDAQLELGRVQLQSAIDANPKLAFLQSSDGQAFDSAKRIDSVLRADPNFAELPLAERFKKVVERYEEVYGAIALKDNVNVGKAAQDAMNKAAKVNKPPSSIADIPGGQVAAVDEFAAIAEKSGAQLTEMFLKMTPGQIETYLNRL